MSSTKPDFYYPRGGGRVCDLGILVMSELDRQIRRGSLDPNSLLAEAKSIHDISKILGEEQPETVKETVHLVNVVANSYRNSSERGLFDLKMSLRQKTLIPVQEAN